MSKKKIKLGSDGLIEFVEPGEPGTFDDELIAKLNSMANNVHAATTRCPKTSSKPEPIVIDFKKEEVQK